MGFYKRRPEPRHPWKNKLKPAFWGKRVANQLKNGTEHFPKEEELVVHHF